jgi:hypothetical protein
MDLGGDTLVAKKLSFTSSPSPGSFKRRRITTPDGEGSGKSCLATSHGARKPRKTPVRYKLKKDCAELPKVRKITSYDVVLIDFYSI